jgi:DNA-binding NarL/FixJ family response regulator
VKAATVATTAETSLEALAVEDDPDVQFLIETIFSTDPRFTLLIMAESAEEAFESARTAEPAIIVLDHGLAGPLTGLDAAPRLKELAPHTKIILFTAHAELQARVDSEPAVDAFLLKTETSRLLPLAQRLTDLDALPPDLLAGAGR